MAGWTTGHGAKTGGEAAMLILWLMIGLLFILAATHTVLLAYEYFVHGATWPLVVWILLVGAIIVDALILKSDSVWWWLGIFW